MNGRTKTLLGGAALAVAFLGGIALAPSFAGSAAAQVLGPLAARVSGATAGADDISIDLGLRPGGDLLKAAADHIGITVDQLRTEMGTDKSMADVAVAHGKTRESLIAALMAVAQDKIGELVDHKGFPQKPPAGLRTVMIVDAFQTSADYLGLTRGDLLGKLRDGQSLGQIADATAGKSRDGLIDAIVAAETAKIDQAQANGRITADQATRLKDALADRVTKLIDATRPFFAPGFGFGPRPGFGFGPHGPRP